MFWHALQSHESVHSLRSNQRYKYSVRKVEFAATDGLINSNSTHFIISCKTQWIKYIWPSTVGTWEGIGFVLMTQLAVNREHIYDRTPNTIAPFFFFASFNVSFRAPNSYSQWRAFETNNCWFQYATCFFLDWVELLHHKFDFVFPSRFFPFHFICSN